jgi:hypothetical protein
MNVEIVTEDAQFLFWEYVNGIFDALLLTQPQQPPILSLSLNISSTCAKTGGKWIELIHTY